jgi:hypothetical protein
MPNSLDLLAFQQIMVASGSLAMVRNQDAD